MPEIIEFVEKSFVLVQKKNKSSPNSWRGLWYHYFLHALSLDMRTFGHIGDFHWQIWTNNVSSIHLLMFSFLHLFFVCCFSFLVSPKLASTFIYWTKQGRQCQSLIHYHHCVLAAVINKPSLVYGRISIWSKLFVNVHRNLNLSHILKNVAFIDISLTSLKKHISLLVTLNLNNKQ